MVRSDERTIDNAPSPRSRRYVKRGIRTIHRAIAAVETHPAANEKVPFTL
jgi:hypothetical protein